MKALAFALLLFSCTVQSATWTTQKTVSTSGYTTNNGPTVTRVNAIFQGEAAVSEGWQVGYHNIRLPVPPNTKSVTLHVTATNLPTGSATATRRRHNGGEYIIGQNMGPAGGWKTRLVSKHAQVRDDFRDRDDVQIWYMFKADRNPKISRLIFTIELSEPLTRERYVQWVIAEQKSRQYPYKTILDKLNIIINKLDALLKASGI